MTKKSDPTTEEIIAKLASPAKEKPKAADLLNSGSTLLNLACSRTPNGAFPKGSQILMVGDSASGKTFLSLTCFSEAVRSKEFENYRLIYDAPENGAIMDWKRFFGKKVAEKVEAPRVEDGVAINSVSVEDFYFHVDSALKEGKPFIYVLDSMDALKTGADSDKFEEVKEAWEKGTTSEVAGSYGVSKAKINSTWVREIWDGVVQSGSFLFIIAQTRDNIGFGAKFNPKTHGGGRALTFFSNVIIWTSIVESITKTVNGKPRHIGDVIRIKVAKNRVEGITGPGWHVDIPITWDYGFDDTKSMIDYLLDEKHWTASKGVITAPEFAFTGKEKTLVDKIEGEKLLPELKKLVGKVWNDVIEACVQDREPRYK